MADSPKKRRLAEDDDEIRLIAKKQKVSDDRGRLVDSNSALDDSLPCFVFSDRFTAVCSKICPKNLKFYNIRNEKPVMPDLDQFLFLIILKVITTLNANGASLLSIRDLIELSMRKELLDETHNYYRAWQRITSSEQRKEFLEIVQDVKIDRYCCLTASAFVIENLNVIEKLSQSKEFRSSIDKDENIWIICLDPLDIVVIVKNEHDRLFFEEDTIVETADAGIKSTKVTVKFFGAKKDEVYSLLTTIQIPANSLATHIKELQNAILEEARSVNLELPENFAINETNLQIDDEENATVTIKNFDLNKIRIHEWKDVQKENRVLRPCLFKNQNSVARVLFERVKIILGDKLKEFEDLHVCVATANYITVKNQTYYRIIKFGLAEDTVNPVWLYNTNENKKDKPYLKFRERDEAHWGYNDGGANQAYVNHEELLTQHNFFVLQVTATPYNILTRQSRLPERYFLAEPVPKLQLEKGSVVSVKEYNHELRSIKIESSMGTAVASVQCLDFDHGEIHVVDWTSTVHQCQQQPHAEDALYPDGEKYYGLTHFLVHSKNQSVQCDYLFDELCDFTENEVATLLADYFFSMLFAKQFFERQNEVIIPKSENEWTTLVQHADFERRVEQFHQDIFGEKSLFRARVPVLKQVAQFYYLKSIGIEEEVPVAVPNIEDFKVFCRHKLQHHHMWTATDKNFTSFNIQKDLSIEFFNLLQQKSVCEYSTKSTPHCSCSDYKPNNNRYCKNCGHTHRRLDSYEDIGSIPVLLILVSKGRLGDTFPKSLDCLDLRIRHRNGPGTVSSAIQELGRMCRYATSEDELPYALVSKELHKKLKPRPGSSTSADHFSNMALDSFMTETNQKVVDVAYPPFKWRRQYQAKQADNYKNRSMDWNAKEVHQNRLLLMAEPQIGKTETYLRLWELLKHEIKGEVIVPNPQVKHIDPYFINDDTCLLPYWKYLNTEDVANYEMTWGKYHPIIFAKRCHLLKIAIAEHDTSEDRIKKYRELLLKDENIQTKRSLSLLDRLLGLKLDKQNLKGDELLQFINWDGIFSKSTAKLQNVSLDKARSIESERSLWEDVTYSAVKSTKCLEQYRLALSANISTVGDCLRCAEWLQKSDTTYVEQIAPFTVQNIHVQATRLSVPFDPLYASVWADMVERKIPSYSHIVFIPSYRVSNGVAFPEKALVNYSHATQKSIIQFLVVRQSTFDRYQEVWGRKCFVLCLPDQITINGKIEDPFTGGIGYARLFIQLFAYNYGLHHVHLWDDNVQRCWKLNFQTKAMEPVYFNQVMQRLEEVAVPSEEHVKHVSNSQNFKAINAQFPQIDSAFPVQSADKKTRVNSAAELFDFDPERIALIGMGRWHMGIFNVNDPFQHRFVYSAVYLNVKKTVEEGCIYPCKPVMEDIDFQHLCFERGLHVMKMNQFIHSKLNWTPNTNVKTIKTGFIRVDKIPPTEKIEVVEAQDTNNLLINWLKKHKRDNTIFMSCNFPYQLGEVSFVPCKKILREEQASFANKKEIVYFFSVEEGSAFHLSSCMLTMAKNLNSIAKISFVVPISKILHLERKDKDYGNTFGFEMTSILCRPLQNNILLYVDDSPYDVFIFVLEKKQQKVDPMILD